MDLTDAEIIRTSLEDPTVFGAVFERHHDAIFRFVARRQGIDRAADLTAETFTRAFSLRGRYDTTRESCRPWLYGIAANIIGDEIRRQRRSERLYLTMIGFRIEENDPFLQSEDRIAAEQQADHLNRSLAKLRSGDRDVLLLYAIDELTYQEIADALHIPIGTVRSRLSRARRRMQELEPQLTQTYSRGQWMEP